MTIYRCVHADVCVYVCVGGGDDHTQVSGCRRVCVLGVVINDHTLMSGCFMDFLVSSQAHVCCWTVSLSYLFLFYSCPKRQDFFPTPSGGGWDLSLSSALFSFKL